MDLEVTGLALPGSPWDSKVWPKSEPGLLELGPGCCATAPRGGRRWRAGLYMPPQQVAVPTCQANIQRGAKSHHWTQPSLLGAHFPWLRTQIQLLRVHANPRPADPGVLRLDSTLGVNLGVTVPAQNPSVPYSRCKRWDWVVHKYFFNP